VPLAVRCFNVAYGTVSWDKISFNRFFLVAYVVEHYLHIPEWYHTPKSDFRINSYGALKFQLGGWPRRTAVVDEEVENLEEKALHLL
jgi:hypothetical protein